MALPTELVGDNQYTVEVARVAGEVIFTTSPLHGVGDRVVVDCLHRHHREIRVRHGGGWQCYWSRLEVEVGGGGELAQSRQDPTMWVACEEESETPFWHLHVRARTQ